MSFTLGTLLYKLGLDKSALDKGLTDSQKKMQAFSKSAVDIGKQLSLKLTLPITLLGGAALKVASDFETSSIRLNTAFKGLEDEAGAAVKSLGEEFGLAGTQATALLGKTGMLLKGMGETGEAALKQSVQIAELATIYSTLNGIPVEQTANAFTMALAGQTRGLREYGIVIDQALIDAELLARGFTDLEAEAAQLAKAQVTLELITRKSEGAIASFAETSDTLSFKTGNLQGAVSDLAASFGTILIPIASDIVLELTELVQYFTALDDSTKSIILVMAGLAAAVGPTIFAIGKLSAAFTFLAANPLVLAVAGVVALTAGIVLLVDAGKKWVDAQNDIAKAGGAAWRDQRLQLLETASSFEIARATLPGLSREMFNAARATGNFEIALNEALKAQTLSTQIEEIEKQLASMSNTSQTAQEAITRLNKQVDPNTTQWWAAYTSEAERFDSALKAIRTPSNQLEDSIRRIATAQQQRNIWNAIQARDAEQLIKALSEIGQETDELIRLRQQLANVQTGLSITAVENEATAAERRRQEAEQTAIATAEAARIQAERDEKEKQSASEILQIIQSQRSEYEKLEQQINTLQSYTWFSGELEKDRLVAIEILRKQQQEITNNQNEAEQQLEQQRVEFNQRYLDRLEQRGDSEIQALERRRDNELSQENLTEESKAAIVSFWENEIAAIIKAKSDEQLSLERDKQKQLEALAQSYRDRIENQLLDDVGKLEAAKQRELQIEDLTQQARLDIIAYYDAEIKKIADAKLDREKQEADKIIADQLRVSEQRQKIEQQALLDIARLSDNKLFILQNQYDAEIAAANEVGAATYAIEEKYAILRAQLLEKTVEERVEIINWGFEQELGYVIKYFETIQNIYENFQDRKLQLIDEALAHSIKALEEEGLAVEDFNTKKSILEKEAEEKKYEIQLAVFKAKKVNALIEIGINQAIAITKALAELGPITGPIAATLIAKLTALQIAAVISQPPPSRPVFLAEGGLVRQRPGGVNAIIGEGRSDELVAPLSDEVFERFANGLLNAIADTRPGRESLSNGQPLTIIIEGMGQIQLDLTQRAIENRKIRIPASSIIRS